MSAPSPAELLALARSVPECGGMERFQDACTPAVVAALCERVAVSRRLQLELVAFAQLNEILLTYPLSQHDPMTAPLEPNA